MNREPTTVADLIDTVMGAIWHQFYNGDHKAFQRDQRHLHKAIARYGHATAERGWQFTAEQIQGDILQLLNEIKRQGTEQIRWLPLYLENAVDRRVRQRAEELRELSLRNQGADVVAGRILDKLPPPAAAAPMPADNEVLNILYRDLNKRQRARRQAKKGVQKL